MFTWLRERIKFKGTKRQGQVATFVLLFVAVAILLVAIFLNISRVAQKRINVANATTGAVLQLSSSLGSYAHMLSCKYLNCGTKRCKFSFLSLIMIVVAAALIVAVAVIGPAAIGAAFGSIFSGGMTLGNLAIIATTVAATTSLVGTVLKFAVFDPQMYSAMNRAFRNMDPSMQICENAIRHAFLNTVDDPAKVADLQDLDMDGKSGFDGEGKPEDLINRFYYKYTQRLIWLTDSGPGPDGSYLGYKSRMRKLLDEFVPALKEFNEQSRVLSDYIGPLPKEGMPAGIALRFLPPEGIPDLYTLFAYLQQEYKVTKNELYDLSYHIDKSTGKPVNIWTQGFVECPDEDTYNPLTGEYGHNDEDENPDLACYHSKKNDELDALAYALRDFNTSQRKGGDDFVGFAPAILGVSRQEQIETFDSWWYHELYSECADDSRAEETAACKSPDYEDYYDQIWEMPDQPATEYLIEKGWNQALEGWLERLDKISRDIKERRIKARFNTYESDRLDRLLKDVETAIDKLRAFKESILVFRQAIERLRDGYDKLQGEPFTAQQSGDYLLYNRKSPTYVWQDSLGKHSVTVEIGPYKLARLKSYKKGCCKRCIKLLNRSGTVWVRITRKDEPTTMKLPGEKVLWKFQYPVTSYTASASYDYGFKPPEFLGIKRNR